MATFDDVVERAKDIFSEAGKKTGDFVSIQKLRVNIADLSNRISKLYRELGKLTYEASKNGTDNTIAIDTIIVEIEQKDNELNILKSKINEMKNKKTCPSCGKANSEDAVFCSYCGEKLIYTYDCDDVEFVDPTVVPDASDNDYEDDCEEVATEDTAKEADEL